MDRLLPRRVRSKLIPALLGWLALLAALLLLSPPEPAATALFTLVDVVTLPTGTTFAETEVGGISAIAYDPHESLYYLLSDDRSVLAPARLYAAAIELVDDRLAVELRAVITLRDPAGDPFAGEMIDPESVALAADGGWFLATEGDPRTASLADPAVLRFDADGRQVDSLPLPARYLFTAGSENRVRTNRGFESLTLSPDGRFLFVATENALAADGPSPSRRQGSPVRVLSYDLLRGRPVGEFVYCVDPQPRLPLIPGVADQGLVEIEALDDAGRLLMLERAYAAGRGNTIRLFAAWTTGATNVADVDALDLDGCPAGEITPMGKQLLLDLEDLGLSPDNVEGLAFGPLLSPNRRLLLLVSDNNFSPFQETQLIALTIDVRALDSAFPDE